MKHVRVSLTERGEPKGVKPKIRGLKNILGVKQGLHVLRYDLYHLISWSEVCYGEVLGDKSTKHITVPLYWVYLIVLWLFHLFCILYCGCFNLFCNVWVCTCGLCNVWVFWQNVYLYLLCFVLFVLFFGIVSFMYILSYLFWSVLV